MTATEPPEPSRGMTREMIESRFVKALATTMGLERARLDKPGTVVIPEDQRAGTSYVVGYRLRQMTCLRVDPSLASEVEELADPERSLSLEELSAWAEHAGWRIVDGGDSNLVTAMELTVRPPPSGATVVALDCDNQAHRDRIAELIDQCDPDDVDAAEIEMDDLDPIIRALVDADGRLGAFASGRRWTDDERFDDIGVITREDLRRSGWGGAVVAAFCQASFALNRLPLYRYNWSRPQSKALSLSLGFRPALSLLAVTPTT